MKKIFTYLMACFIVLSSLAFGGCSKKTDGAETALKFYFSALKGFNVNAMKENVQGETAGDMGFVVEELSEDFRQSDNYKKHIEEMMKSLSSTFEFTINSNEVVDENTVKFNITMKSSDVNQEALNGYMQEKVDKYIAKNPSVWEMDAYEYEETMIGVQADAYSVFLEKQPRITKDFTITVVKVNDKWKVTTADNSEFFAFLQEVYAGGNDAEAYVEPEVTEGEETVEE